MDWEKFGIFVLLLVFANFLSGAVNQLLPQTEGVIGWFVGILVPSGILWLLFKYWGKKAGVQVEG